MTLIWENGLEGEPNANYYIEPLNMDILHNPSTNVVTIKGTRYVSSRVMRDGSLEDIPLSPGVEMVFASSLCLFVDIYKEDDQAYVFTLKNPLQTNPVRLKIQREKNIAIRCNPYYGPIFGDRQNCLFQIGSYCNRQYGCYVSTERNDPYEIHSRYQFSSFLNSTPKNWFTILEYEVYQVFDEIEEDVDISTLIDNDIEELVDSPIESSDSESLSFSSNVLLDTHIINHQYDDYLIEWFGGLQWKLIYRASEHDYTTESFHEYCDNQGSTLILIKSSEGWIFGGYTTQSWETSMIDSLHCYIHRCNER